MNLQLGINVCGWIGAVSLLWAYGMISMGKVSAGTISYQLANLVGSILLLINTAFYGAYPSSAVNLLWIGVASLSLLRSLRTTRNV